MQPAVIIVDFLSHSVTFLNELFLLANTTSEALQFSDTDLASAATAVEGLRKAVVKLRQDDGEFERLYAVAIDYCGKLGIQVTSKTKRKRTVPLA